VATVTETIYREAPDIEARKLGLLDSAKALADKGLTLPQQQVAALSSLQQQAAARTGTEGGVGGYQNYLTTGAGTLGTSLGGLGSALETTAGAYDPLQAGQQAISGTGQLFAPSDLSAYTNPYQQAVIDTTLAEINRQGDIARNKLSAQGVGAGAFGGSRFGVQGAELDRNLADARAKALAQLNAQNYTQALGTSQAAFENQQRRQQEQSKLYGGIAGLYGNLGAQQAGVAGQQAAVAGQQLGLGQLAQTAGLKEIAIMQQMGQEQQRYDQAALDAARTNEQRQLYEPYGRVAFLSDIYKGAPSTQQTLGSMVAPPPPSPSAFQQIAGAGTGILGAAVAGNQLSGLFS